MVLHDGRRCRCSKTFGADMTSCSGFGKTLDCNTGYVCIYSKASVSLMTTHNRKMLAGLEEKKKTVKLGLQVSAATSMKGGSYVGSELRNTPSGPDPLHHNGGSPKMPSTGP
nr:hypothetical protein CFP56_67458 [Quercus suber]